MSIWEKAIHLFKEISKIPRQSNVVKDGKILVHHEQQVLQYFQTWALTHDFAHSRDEYGNICIFIPWTQGREKQAPVILQGHMDMVCVKSGKIEHDFEIDPIVVTEENGWLKASETTLGADNLVWVCLALSSAFLESHPPLEILITATEETGMIGASQLDPSIVSGDALHMINLDTEVLWEIIIWCAWGGKAKVSGVFETYEYEWEVVQFSITGWRGGHSWLEIWTRRANIVYQTACFLSELTQTFSLISFVWWQRDNAIAWEVTVCLEVKNVWEFTKKLEAFYEKLKDAFDEPNISLTVESLYQRQKTLSEEDTQKLLTALWSIKSWVYAYLEDIPDFVETSCNLWYIALKDGHLTIKYALRSSYIEEVEKMAAFIENMYVSIWCKSEVSGIYPWWLQDVDAPFVQRVKKAYEDVLGQESKLLAVHAWLECGVLSNRLWNHLEIVSFWPNIMWAHSVDETCEIQSIHTISTILENILHQYDVYR